jgi:hypothetical protein
MADREIQVWEKTSPLKCLLSSSSQSRPKDLNRVTSASFFEIFCGKDLELLANKPKLRNTDDLKKQVQIYSGI